MLEQWEVEPVGEWGGEVGTLDSIVREGRRRGDEREREGGRERREGQYMLCGVEQQRCACEKVSGDGV